MTAERAAKFKRHNVLEPSHYHLHIYFADLTETAAMALFKLAQEKSNIESVGRFHTKPVGPHPVRQFQLLVSAENLISVEAWLQDVRGDLDVLIHPEIEDDLFAHTELARWLGSPHTLHLEIFKR